MYLRRLDDQDFHINDVGKILINGDQYDDSKVDSYFNPSVIFAEYIK